jgi:transposase
MANKSISMSKVRQIIKLYTQQMGKKKIGERLGMSKHTVKLYIDHFRSLKTPKEELFKLSDFELNKLFHPPRETLINDQLKQLYDFFPVMSMQLRRRGMTVARQFLEYKLLYPQSYGETSFYKHYNQWRKKVNPTMHIEHKVGDKMYVDYAGATLPYVDTNTGEISNAQVFVAILGWSQYAYVEAMQSQAIEEFIAACENALRYFNGVPLALVPDNLKSAVHKASSYEPIVNENFKAFTDHYGIAILPARSRKPQDKAHVENMVKLSYQKIYANLPEKEVVSLKELNMQIGQHLVALNDAQLTGKQCSRTDQWLMELSALHPLPATMYEMRKLKQVTVMKNGHVYLSEDQHYYSVPYELIGKKLKMQYSRSEVNLYLHYELIATHKRLRSPHNYTTVAEHMPAQHRYVMEWNPAFFMAKAKEIDPVVEYYIGQVLAKKQHPEQGYKSCMGILSFAKRLGNIRLIKACKRAHEIGYYNYKIIEDILTKNLDKYDDDDMEPSSMPTHDNIRGGNYYQ